MDRNGKTTSLRRTSADWSNLQFSPDGRRLALDINDGKQTDVWVYDWARDTLVRLTLEVGVHQMPLWTPDGRRIAFQWAQPGNNIDWRRADGGGDVQRLTTNPNFLSPGSWHPSGKFLVFVELSPATNYDLAMLQMDGDEPSGWKPGKPTAFLNTPAAETWPAFSPDGRWIAYDSNESGRGEVYVRPFPGPGGKWQISAKGGAFPVWSRARKELLYATPDNRIMTASYAAQVDSFTADMPRLWSDVRFSPRSRGQLGNNGRPFDLHPDGERVAIAPVAETQGAAKADKLVFVFNFFDELRRIAPVTKR